MTGFIQVGLAPTSTTVSGIETVTEFDIEAQIALQQAAQPSIFADGAAGERDGNEQRLKWSNLGSGDKINWYFFAPSLAGQSVTLRNIRSIFAVLNKIGSRAPFIFVYTAPLGDGGDLGGWYRSRVTFSRLENAAETGYMQLYAKAGADVEFGLGSLALTENFGGQDIKTATYLDEDILYIGIGSDSSESTPGAYNFALTEMGYQTSDGKKTVAKFATKASAVEPLETTSVKYYYNDEGGAGEALANASLGGGAEYYKLADGVIRAGQERVTWTGHGFTVGAPLYLSADGTGDPTQTAPSTDGHAVQELGYVIDANTVLFKIGDVSIYGGGVEYGRQVLVDAVTGLDTNDGATQPVQTLVEAHSKAGNGQTIVVAEGEYAAQAALTITKQDITVIGPAAGAGGVKTTTPAITATGIGPKFANLKVASLSISHPAGNGAHTSGVQVVGTTTVNSLSFYEDHNSKFSGAVTFTGNGARYVYGAQFESTLSMSGTSTRLLENTSHSGNITITGPGSSVALVGVAALGLGATLTIGPGVVYSMSGVSGFILAIDANAVRVANALKSGGYADQQAKEQVTTRFMRVSTDYLHVAGDAVYDSIELPNFSAGGVISAAVVEAYSFVQVNQSTAGIVLSIASPVSYTTKSRRLCVTNSGTVVVTVAGVDIGKSGCQDYVWSRGRWVPDGAMYYASTSLKAQVHDGLSYKDAKADAVGTTAAFVLLSSGERISDGVVKWIGHGLVEGAIYYLSADTAGGFTSIKPTSGDSIVQEMFRVGDANTLHVNVQPAVYLDGAYPVAGITPQANYGSGWADAKADLDINTCTMVRLGATGDLRISQGKVRFASDHGVPEGSWLYLDQNNSGQLVTSAPISGLSQRIAYAEDSYTIVIDVQPFVDIDLEAAAYEYQIAYGEPNYVSISNLGYDVASLSVPTDGVWQIDASVTINANGGGASYQVLVDGVPIRDENLLTDTSNNRTRFQISIGGNELLAGQVVSFRVYETDNPAAYRGDMSAAYVSIEKKASFVNVGAHTLMSPDGTRWKLEVSNAGALTLEEII